MCQWMVNVDVDGRVAAVVEKEIKNTFRNSRATDQLNVLVDFYVFPILSPLLHSSPQNSTA